MEKLLSHPSSIKVNPFPSFCLFACPFFLPIAVLGLLTSELVCSGSVKTLDISPFNPGRFIKKAKGRGRKQVDDDVGEQW